MEFVFNYQGLGLLFLIAVGYVGLRHKKYKVFWVYPIIFLLVYVYSPIKTVTPKISKFEAYSKPEIVIPNREVIPVPTLNELQTKLTEKATNHAN